MRKSYADYLPKMLQGEELMAALRYIPEYDEGVRELPEGQRMLRLMDLYKVFVPGNMAREIYQRLYTMTALSLKKKGTIDAVRQGNENHKAMTTGEFCGVITGISSATIIGTSGVGKTTCIQKAVKLLGPTIESENTRQKIVPAVIVTTPFDCNYKGLLLQILLALDEALDTNYYEKSQRSSYNASQLLGMVTQLCLLHVGILIIDEIQFLCEHRTGKQLYRMILELINCAGIGVVMVGTPECTEYFANTPQMARRTVGLQYGYLDYGEEFSELCRILFSMQFVKQKTDLDEGTLSWLYEHSAGCPGTLMSLIHDAQEIAIAKGIEYLNQMALTEAYSSRLKMLHGHIERKKTVLSSTSKKKKEKAVELIERVKELSETEEMAKAEDNDFTLAELAALAEYAGREALVAIYKEHFVIEEVAIC